MLFLRARRAADTSAWWSAAAAAPDRPVIVTELLRDDSVVCDAPEAEDALAWARSLAGWDEQTPALFPHDPIAERLADGVWSIAAGIDPLRR